MYIKKGCRILAFLVIVTLHSIKVYYFITFINLLCIYERMKSFPAFFIRIFIEIGRVHLDLIFNGDIRFIYSTF